VETTETDADLEDKVVELYRSGAKLDEIKAETGYERPKVFRTLAKRGIRPDRTHRNETEVNTDQLLLRLDAQAREIGRLEAENAAKQATIDTLLAELKK
jgi:hypothetical protein